MPIGSAPIQETNTATSAGTVMTLTLPSVPITGNTVFVGFMGGGTAEPTVSSLGATGFSSWTRETNHGAGVNAHLELWRGVVSGSPTATITINMSVSPSGAVRGYAAEWPGLYTKDGTSGSANGNSATPVSATLTPSAAVPMLFFAFCRRGGTFSGGAGNPTNGFVTGTTGDSTKRLDYMVTASAVSTNTTWTFTAAAPYDTEIVSFTQNAGGGPTYTLPVTVGSFALTGNVTGLKAGRVIQPNAASFIVIGNDVQLVGPARPSTYTLVAGTGVFILGPPIPNQASYIITGNAVVLRYSGYKAKNKQSSRRRK